MYSVYNGLPEVVKKLLGMKNYVIIIIKFIKGS